MEVRNKGYFRLGYFAAENLCSVSRKITDEDWMRWGIDEYSFNLETIISEDDLVRLLSQYA